MDYHKLKVLRSNFLSKSQSKKNQDNYSNKQKIETYMKISSPIDIFKKDVLFGHDSSTNRQNMSRSNRTNNTNSIGSYNSNYIGGNKDSISMIQKKYQQYECMIQKQKMKLEQQEKWPTTEQTFQQIKDVQDRNEIVNALTKLKMTGDRISLIDKIIQRKKELKEENEQAQYFKLSDILEKTKKKFLSKLKRREYPNGNQQLKQKTQPQLRHKHSILNTFRKMIHLSKQKKLQEQSKLEETNSNTVRKNIQNKHTMKGEQNSYSDTGRNKSRFKDCLKQTKQDYIQSEFEYEMAQSFNNFQNLFKLGKDKVDQRILGKLGLNDNKDRFYKMNQPNNLKFQNNSSIKLPLSQDRINNRNKQISYFSHLGKTCTKN